ncbi:type IV pilus biogenesis protein PilP [Methylotenera sp.]|uniref:type IV pilus biogenesis protein PilP n=1 Tax=Methylotenera sp. TaxID=2051956 RepID=UPI002EDB0059
MNTKKILALVALAIYAAPAMTFADVPAKKIPVNSTKMPSKQDPLADPVANTVNQVKPSAVPSNTPVAAPVAATAPTEEKAPKKAEYNNPNVGNFSELDELRSQNALLTEKLKKAEFQSKMNGTGGTNVPSVGTLSTSTRVRPSKKSKDITDYDARVRLVSGIGSNLSATIVFSDGSKSIARAGSRIDGLGTVRSINTNEVIVTSGKESYAIPFEAEPAINSTLGGLSAAPFQTQSQSLPFQQ